MVDPLCRISECMAWPTLKKRINSLNPTCPFNNYLWALCMASTVWLKMGGLISQARIGHGLDCTTTIATAQKKKKFRPVVQSIHSNVPIPFLSAVWFNVPYSSHIFGELVNCSGSGTIFHTLFFVIKVVWDTYLSSTCGRCNILARTGKIGFPDRGRTGSGVGTR